MITRCLPAGIVLLLVGCATGPTSSPLLVSASVDPYTVPAVVQVLATNQSNRPLYLPSCIQEEQRSTKGSWVPLGNGMCASTTELLRVAPGATDSTLSATFFATGTYRVGVYYDKDSSLTRAGESFSNSFGVAQ